MIKILSSTGLAAYVLLAALALLWWSPHFFAANLHLLPQLNYRYVAATGLPFGVMLMIVAARQSLMPRFSLVLVLEVVLAGVALFLGLLSFQYLPQSVFFCAAHLAICGVASVFNLYGYRRDLAAWQKRRAALNA